MLTTEYNKQFEIIPNDVSVEDLLRFDDWGMECFRHDFVCFDSYHPDTFLDSDSSSMNESDIETSDDDTSVKTEATTETTDTKGCKKRSQCFIQKLLNIVSHPMHVNGPIRWDPTGMSIEITNISKFRPVCKEYFHIGYRPFLKRLEAWGFHRCTYKPSQRIVAYSHPLFVKGCEEVIHRHASQQYFVRTSKSIPIRKSNLISARTYSRKTVPYFCNNASTLIPFQNGVTHVPIFPVFVGFHNQ